MRIFRTFAGLAGEGVGGAHEHVLAELGEVAAVLEPGPGGGYVVGGGLALRLDEDGQAVVVAAVPGGPGVQGLEAVAIGIDGDLDAAPSSGGRDVAGLAGVESGPRGPRGPDSGDRA